MMKFSRIVLLLGLLLFVSCKEEASTCILDQIETDFPVSEELNFQKFNKFDNILDGWLRFDDKVIWDFNSNKNDFGACYDLNTGEKVSTIVTFGKALYELWYDCNYQFQGDSLQFSLGSDGIIKTFSTKDIVENVPMHKRGYTVAHLPDSIYGFSLYKLLNGSIVTTIPTDNRLNKVENSIDRSSVVIYSPDEIRTYQTLDYDALIANKKTRKNQIPLADQIKLSHSNGFIKARGNDIAVFTLSRQFLLYTLDLNNGTVLNRKHYTEILPYGDSSRNRFNTEIKDLVTNDDYIFCRVEGYSNEKDKEDGIYRETLYIFDWNLNPIKRHDLPLSEDGRYVISNDCKYVYRYCYSEEGVEIDRAAL